MNKTIFTAIFFGAAMPLAAYAACTPSNSAARCLTAPEPAELPFPAGTVLPRGQYQVLLNTEYYGLPPSRDGVWYFRVEGRILRVHNDTMEVVEDVTHMALNAI